MQHPVRFVEVGCEQVAEALYELYKQYPELASAPLSIDAAHGEGAVSLLLALSRGDWTAWSEGAPGPKGTAAALLMDFLAKVMGEHPSLRQRTWRVPAGNLPQQALSVIGQELARSHPRQAGAH